MATNAQYLASLVNSSGNVNIPVSNAGINFNNSSAIGASTLTDYETGTWTPTLTRSSTAPSVSYAFQLGYYTKIGNTVSLYGEINWSSLSGGSGTYWIGSLPFTIANLTRYYPQGQVQDIGGITFTGYTWMGLEASAPNTSTLTLVCNASALSQGGIGATAGTSLASSGAIYFNIVYQTTF